MMQTKFDDRAVLRTCCLMVFWTSIGMLSGCGGGGKPKVYSPQFADAVQVKGTLTLDGQPVPEANITFVFEGTPPKGFVSAGGLTDSSGKYQVRSGDKLGMPPGRYKVVIHRWGTADGKPFKENSESGMDLEQAKLAGIVKELIPAKYSDAEQSQLTVEITKDQKDPVNFELTSK